MGQSTRLQNTALLLSLLVTLISVGVFIGWHFDIVHFKSVFPNQITMKANTAINLFLCSLSVAYLSLHFHSRFTRYGVSLVAFYVLIIAGLTLIEYFSGLDFGIDQLWFTDKTQSIHPGRMSITTAYCTVNLAVALLLLAFSKMHDLSKAIFAALSTTIVLIPGVIFLTYIPNVFLGSNIWNFGSMGFHTALSFILLGISLLLILKNEKGFNWVLSQSTTYFAILLLLSVLITSLASTLGVYLSLTILSIGLFLLNSGVSNQKRTESIHRQLASIVESSNDAIISKDLNSNIVSWNIGAEHMFGYTAKEMIGKSILILIPDDRKHEEPEILARIVQGEKIEHFETVRKRKDEKLINVSVTISPVKNENGEIVGASKIVRDFSEQKQLESQLRQSQKMNAIGQLTGGVAHDFNNILGVILGNLDLLERNIANNEEALNRVKTISKATTRGADLTKRLLSFSRSQPLTPVTITVPDSVNNVIEMATRTVGPDFTIKSEIEKSLPTVFADATEFESAILNLIINARDAMPKGGTILISGKSKVLEDEYLAVQAKEIKPGQYICISVTDTGTGIPKDVLERVFEPFFTTKERGKGTGMGLSMVYGFVKQSGGVTRIYSEVGHGTTVSMYFPFTEDKKQAVKQDVQITKAKMSGKVLAVDDEADLLDIAGSYLKEMGFEVLYATDAKSALEIFERTPEIKLLVTDIVMPGGVNGIELAERIKKLKPDIIVVFTSGFPSGALSKTDIETGKAILINKPYDRETFSSAVYRAIQEHTGKSHE